MGKTVADRLQYIMQTRGLKQVDILRLCDAASISMMDQTDVRITKSDLSQYVSGKTEPGTDKGLLLAKALHVNVGWLFGFVDDPDLTPVYEVAAGEGRISDAPTGTMDLRLQDGQYIATVIGRSMEPTLMDGDQVIINRQSILDRDGQIAMVKVNGDENTLKRVQVKEDGLLLIGDNVDVYPPHFFTGREVQELPVRIVGVVVKLMRDL